jgi:hypothetical protein
LAAKSNGKPRSSIVVLETTSTIKATERDARRNGHPTALATHPDLTDLEKRIKASHHRCGSLARKSEKLARERIAAAKETGDLLIQLKSLIGHGKWQTWVKAQCGMSRRTAWDYMTIAENWTIIEPLIDPKRRPAAVLSLKSILRHLAKRKAARDTGESGHSDTGATSSRSEPDQQAEADPDDDPANATAENTADAAGAEDRPDRSESAEARREADDEGADRRRDEDGADGQRAERADRRTCSAKTAGSARDDDEATAADPGATTRSEDQLDDQKWLASLPIRQTLEVTAVFDEDALLWRHVFDALTRLIEGRGRDVHKFVAEFSNTLRFPHRVSELLTVRHPRDWIACLRCSGKGHKKGQKKPCSGCDGAAYWAR